MFEVDGHACLIEILDTAGIDQYLSLNDMFIRDSDGFVLVFSYVLSLVLSLMEKNYSAGFTAGSTPD